MALRLLAALSMLVSLVAFGGAQAASEKAALTPVATGLNNPRGLSFAPDGSLYVAEAGTGGTAEPCRVSAEGGDECYGTTGAIVRVTLGITPTQQRVVSGLPSLAAPSGPLAGGGATGPHDVSVLGNGDIYAVIGLGAPPISRTTDLDPVGTGFGQLLKVPSNDAVPYNDADLAAYEEDQDPDGAGADSNPYSVLALRDWRVAVDAGGNSLLAILPDDTIVTLATFPTRDVPFPPGLPFGPPPGTPVPMQAVPTSVTIGPDGAFYVGELTGFPFPVDGARVYRVAPGEEPTVYASGFTAIIDLAFDADGNLYVLELAEAGLLQAQQPGGDFTGQLLRAEPPISPGTPVVTATTVISTGLTAPGGVALSPEGGIYVTNLSVAPGAGQVLWVDTCEDTPDCAEPQAPDAPLSAFGRGANELNAQGEPNQGDPDGVAPAIFTFNSQAGQVCVQSTLVGLEPLTVAHIHIGDAGEVGPPIVDLTPLIALSSEGALSGCVTTTPQVVNAILANPAGYYYNVHTQTYPAGAARDQLAVGTSGVSAVALPTLFR
jgi:sugar lactone lactonase YvrE